MKKSDHKHTRSLESYKTVIYFQQHYSKGTSIWKRNGFTLNLKINSNYFDNGSNVDNRHKACYETTALCEGIQLSSAFLSRSKLAFCWMNKAFFLIMYVIFFSVCRKMDRADAKNFWHCFKWKKLFDSIQYLLPVTSLWALIWKTGRTKYFQYHQQLKRWVQTRC